MKCQIFNTVSPPKLNWGLTEYKISHFQHGICLNKSTSKIHFLCVFDSFPFTNCVFEGWRIKEHFRRVFEYFFLLLAEILKATSCFRKQRFCIEKCPAAICITTDFWSRCPIITFSLYNPFPKDKKASFSYL